MLEADQIKTVAVVGSGIAGLTAAYLLSKRYAVTVFEKNNYIGGHTNTVDVKTADGDFAIDTGFIVFNEKTYPNFCKLLQSLNVESQKTNMSFSFSSQRLDLEYKGGGLNSLFAQRKNFFRPNFYRMLKSIVDFNQAARDFVNTEYQVAKDIVLNDFLIDKNYHAWFKKTYLMPLTSAIWSSPNLAVGEMPAKFILEFYRNHGLLNLKNHPQWFVIKGGSKQYIKPLIKNFSDRIKLNAEIKKIKRNESQVTVETYDAEMNFDAIVMACHSDQALRLLQNPSDDEVNILGSIPYVKNQAILHNDTSMMPKCRRAWASWNYRDQTGEKASLTYYMNSLQNINSREKFYVSLNCADVAESKIIRKFTYFHPSYNLKSIAAKASHNLINAKHRTFYTGAYWGYGFHEDAVVATINALKPLGLGIL